MKSDIDYGKIIAIGLIALLTTAILSTSALNTFSEKDDEEEQNDSDNNDNDNNDNDEEQEEKHEEETDTGTEIDVKAEIVGNSTMVKVELKFTSNSTSKESLLKEIMTNIRLNNETISNILEVETEDDENEDEAMKEKEKPRVKVEIEDGTAEVEFEYKFVVNATRTDAIVAAIVKELQNLKLDGDDIELKMEKEGKHEVKKEFKVKDAANIAKKAKEEAEKEGKHEFVENIDKAEKYFGKLDKAVVALKIGLESGDIESTSFGSAQLILVKIGNNEPMFRAVVNILTDQPIHTLTACLDGNSIGQLTIVHTSNELGLSIGHLKETLTGSSITVPGVTVDIVNGTDCKGTPMLSGTV